MNKVQQRWVLSGGIGSGKSEVRRLLSGLGVRTIDADAVGHSVLEPDGAAFEAVAGRWPAVVSHGRIDRRALGVIVFKNKVELRELEEITHPVIFGKITADVEGIQDVVVVEIPILSHRLTGEWRRIVVDIPAELQVSRGVEGGLSQEEVLDRLASQPTRSEWLAAADLVIPNHGSIEDLETAVLRVHRVISRT